MYPKIQKKGKLDGNINGESLNAVMPEGAYEATGARLKGDGWICGRTTMQQHFAEPEPFVSKSKKKAGPQPVFVARKAKSSAVSVDTTGKLLWKSGDLDGDHLICGVSERAPKDCLEMLRDGKVSYIVSGKESVELKDAVAKLREHFGIRTLLLEGGGHINGAFLEAGLVDEVSVIIAAGIDGRHEIPALFGNVSLARTAAVRLKLKSVKKPKKGALWIRYKVIPVSD